MDYILLTQKEPLLRLQSQDGALAAPAVSVGMKIFSVRVSLERPLDTTVSTPVLLLCSKEGLDLGFKRVALSLVMLGDDLHVRRCVQLGELLGQARS